MEIINNDQENQNQAYEIARKKVKKIKSFYTHLIVFVLVNAFLLAMRYFDLDPNEQFFTFRTFSTLFFWGIGLAAHAFSVFVPHFIFGTDWEERKVKEYMNKEKDKRWE